VVLQTLVLPLLMVLLTGSWSSSVEPSRAAIAPALPFGSLVWPVEGPVIRGFDPPETPYGTGHRGLDIAVAPGTVIAAPQSGIVSFSGKVGGELFITIDHGGQLSSTCSWVSSSAVHRGEAVSRGQPIGTTGTGHPGSIVPHLHFGVRLAGVYVDPLDYLAPSGVEDLIRLVPIPA
jgi:murein DD-endopeptidase MepM/ murein hydrolase activator NlpD